VSDPVSDVIVYAARLVRIVRRSAELPASARVLSVLDQIGPSGVGQLALADGSSQPSMSAQVNALLADGLVTKEPNPDDARASVISMTDAGRASLAESRVRMAEATRARLADHTPEEIATAIAVLKSLTEKGIQ
jgi:DNA-binding MarR family transcriptional regulator